MTRYAVPSGARTVVLGRDVELAWLSAWYQQAVAGQASRALVVGPGGIGKSTLVDAYAAEATDAVVVRVEADGDQRPGAFLDLLHAALGGNTAVDGGHEDAVSQLLEALGSRQDEGPVLLVLHDLHDLDEASTHVLARTARRLRHDRVLLIGTARPDGLAAVWTRLFAGSPEAGTRVLRGLDRDAVGALVAQLRPGRWSRAAISRLQADTDGHPLHLTTMLRELPDDVLLGDAPLPAPRSLAEDVWATRARLSRDARLLLSCLAVIGHPCGRSLLGRFETLAEVRLEAAARELTAAGLVDALELGARTTFRVHHPLVRSAIYGFLDPEERSRLHLDAARAVGGGAALGHRVAAADGHPDPVLAEDLESAAAAEPADQRAAATWLLAAAEVSATGAEAQRRLLAGAVLLVDAFDNDRLLALAPAVRAAEPSPERDVVLGFLLSQGQDPTACVHLQHALDDTGADGEVRALAGVRLALEHIFRGRGASADETAARVPELTRQPLRTEQALILRAVGRAQAVDPDEGLTLLSGHLQGALGADPSITAGTLHLAAGRIHEARTRLEEGIARTRSGATSTSTHRAHCHLAEVLFRCGRWDIAEAEADIARDWFADGDRPWAESLAHAVSALVPAARAHSDAAEQHIAAGRASLARTHNPQGAHALALAEATLARALGDGPRMERALRELPATASRGMSSGPFAPWRALHAEALVAVGDLSGARAALRSWSRSGAPLWFRLARALLHGRISSGRRGLRRRGNSSARRYRARGETPRRGRRRMPHRARGTAGAARWPAPRR